MSVPVFRFAPSPNGPLHLGHAFSALTTFRAAREAGGRFLLRIEDIDTARCREEYVAQIFDDLAWLGIEWEEPVMRQSDRTAAYGAAARRLDDLGILYPCFATRGEIARALPTNAPIDPEGTPLYPGLYRDLSEAERARRRAAGEAHALRLDMARALEVAKELSASAPLQFEEVDDGGTSRGVVTDPGRWGDAVVVRKDIPTSYHLAVVVDDAEQGVTHVTRGRDLFGATDLQRLLQTLLGVQAPIYSHHELILDEAGLKLSKSAGALSLASLREDGAAPADIARLVGLDPDRDA